MFLYQIIQPQYYAWQQRKGCEQAQEHPFSKNNSHVQPDPVAHEYQRSESYDGRDRAGENRCYRCAHRLDHCILFSHLSPVYVIPVQKKDRIVH